MTFLCYSATQVEDLMQTEDSTVVSKETHEITPNIQAASTMEHHVSQQNTCIVPVGKVLKHPYLIYFYKTSIYGS